jgi:hypothetical protein
MTPKRPVMLGEYLFRKLGYRRGTKAAAFIVAWGLYSDSLGEGESWSVEAYAKYWGESFSTAYRELNVFREAFPDDGYPFRVWGVVRDSVEARKSRSLPVAMAQVLPVVGTWS